MGFALTQEQAAAVGNRGGGLLVSAAAGSGKTRVLVERLLSHIRDEGGEIDRFLVITYTKAAAAELRARIIEELSACLAENPTDAHLRRQATLVYQAHISTVHAFCAQLLRECGHLLDCNPDFRLADEGDATLLSLRALEDVLNQRYEGLEEGSDFAQLVDTMAAGRDDSRLVQIVLDIRGRIQSHPNPSAWLDAQQETFALEGITDAGDTPWGGLLLADARSQVAYQAKRLAVALTLTAGDEKLTKSYAPSLQVTLEALQALEQALTQGWDAAAAKAQIPFPKLGAVRNCADSEGQARVKAIRETCKKRMGKLQALLADSSDDLLDDMRQVYPAIRGLFALVKDFERAYTLQKQRRGLLDFSDLEHLAVALMTDEQGAPSALARQWSTRYDEIMVDEYQDTNEVQNAIFTALSRDGRNLFMVGDVKQSVYRFRLADPTIFLGKYHAFPPAAQAAEGEPRRIVLSKNFRSRPEILEGANFIFRTIMSRDFGEMDYTDDEALYPGRVMPQEDETAGNTYAVELDALDFSQDDAGEASEEKPARDLQEALFVAARIRALLDEGLPVPDGEGGTRPLVCGDIVILLRSPNTVLHHYARALGEQDLPWQAEGGGDFFAATEVAVALSLLEIVDNPRQDVPLISALRSPVYAFSPDRLAQLRAASPNTDFYDALLCGAKSGGADCSRFLAELDQLRFQAVDESSHQLLWQIYDRTNLLGIFGAMDEGETRQGNLLTLCELSRRFEEAGHKGLFGFLSYLTRLREHGAKLAVPQAGRTGGGVRIMSIHKSKGLEFPLVFLCGLARQFNREDTKRPILFHPKLGVGPKRLDTQRMVEYPTLARRGVARQLEYEMLAEEMRLLYVAMTRAKEKLILTCALTGGPRDLAKLAPDAGCPVEPQVLSACSSMAQWILLATMARPEAMPLRQAAGIAIVPPPVAFGPLWDIRFITPPVDGAAPMGATTERPIPGPQAPAEARPAEQEVARLAARFAWQYPHGADVNIPSKLTATQLKGRDLDQEVEEHAAMEKQPRPLRTPRFAQEQLGLTPAQKGTAVHLVMQYMDFQQGGSVEAVAQEIARLVALQMMTPQQGEAVPPEKIAAFFASDLGRTVVAAQRLRREFKFSILVPASDYYPQAGQGEQVLLQGVVDCYFETTDGITIIDFKSDQVTEQTMALRAEAYRGQLAAYGKALEAVTGQRVTRRVLWFFATNAAVDCT